MIRIWPRVLVFFYFIGFTNFIFAQNIRQHAIIQLSGNDSINIRNWKEEANILEKKKDLRTASQFLDNIAFVYWEHNYYREAIQHFSHSVQLNEMLYNQSGIAMLNNNLAMIYSDISDFENSYLYFNKTLAYRKAHHEKIGEISAQINISVVLNNLKRFDESITRLEEALTLARETNDINQMKSCYGMLAETFERAGRYDKSIFYFGLYRDFHEKIQKEKDILNRTKVDEVNLKLNLIESEKRNRELELRLKSNELQELTGSRNTLLKSLTKKQLQIEVMNRDKELSELHTKHEIENRKNESIKHRNQVIIVLSLMGFLLSIVFFVVKSNLARKKNNELLEKQNQEIYFQKELLESANRDILKKNQNITSSINYAQKIQYSILPSDIEIKKVFPNFFVYFRPKDIIGGDFYWFYSKPNLSYIAVVDCTGHSVPGALMSMTVNTLLNEIMFEQADDMPDMILSKLHQKIYKTLQQQKGDEYSQDGCDISLCLIDHEKNTLHYAAARNNAYIFQDQKAQVLKATSKSIGGLSLLGTSEPERSFKLVTTEIIDGSLLLMSTDGILDQLNAEDHAFGINRFKDLGFKLYDNKNIIGDKIVAEIINYWKKENDQQDDMLVLGIVLSKK